MNNPIFTIYQVDFTYRLPDSDEVNDESCLITCAGGWAAAMCVAKAIVNSLEPGDCGGFKSGAKVNGVKIIGTSLVVGPQMLEKCRHFNDRGDDRNDKYDSEIPETIHDLIFFSDKGQK